MTRQVGSKGLVCHTDINWAMLDGGRRRLVDEGLFENVCSLQVNGEALPLQMPAFTA